jgi:hypothetical protein
VFLLNKNDLHDQWAIPDAEPASLRQNGRWVQPSSARTGEGVEDAFMALPFALPAEAMGDLPAMLAVQLRALIYSERALACLQIDTALTRLGAGGHLKKYALGAVRLGEPATERAFFLEGAVAGG